VSERIAAIGAGRMGVGIALTFAYAGFPVTLVDLKQRPPGQEHRALDAAAAEVDAALRMLEGAGALDGAAREEIGSRVDYRESAEASEALAAADAVFEAVPEVLEVKREALGAIGAAAPAHALVASTTSSFLVDTLASYVREPGRFLNTHWLNPAYLIPLVEVSPGAATAPETLTGAVDLLERAGRAPVECAPSPGYIVPRIQALAMNEAARLVEEGVATPEAVDRASRLGFGLRFAVLGLLEFIDWGGNDILFHASNYLRDSLESERYAPPESVERNMREGALGMRSGRGFHDFEGRDLDTYRQETIAKFVDLLRHLELLAPPATGAATGLDSAGAATADVAVVGAGVIGLSVAFFLGERDAGDVVVYERSAVAAGASGVQPGGVRQQWGTAVSCDLARESVAFYRELEERLGVEVDSVLESSGYLFLAHSDAVLAGLRRNVELQNGVGIPSRILSPSEAASVAPGLRAGTLAGASWCAEDGYFTDARAVVDGFARAARRHGASLRLGEVVAIRPDGDGWLLSLADGSQARAGQVVVAAGCGSPALVSELGLELPIAPEPRHLFFSPPLPARLLDPLVMSAERRVAAKQLADGRLLASDLAAAGDASESSDVWLERLRAGLRELLPMLARVPLHDRVSGLYDATPDHQPVLGSVQGLPGLWLAAGFSGHGFTMAPAAGRRLADSVAGAGADEALGLLGLSRFAENRLLSESQIV
jgi:3-hydroxybutyryl-CoA dehydrogenase